MSDATRTKNTDTYFHVKIHNITATQIPAYKGLAPDVYVDVNFDNFKYFKTEVERKAVNPVWKKSKEFFYETKYLDKLDKKVVSFTLKSSFVVSDDVEIGIVEIDLLSIAAGSVVHDLPILQRHFRQRPGDPLKLVPTGARLRVEIEMDQLSSISLVLQNLRLKSFRVSKNLRLGIRYSRELENQKSVYKTKKPQDVATDELTWNPTFCQFYTSLRDLYSQSFTIECLAGTVGNKDHLEKIKITIPFQKLLESGGLQSKSYEFSEVVIDEGKVLGTFSCTITLEDLPKFSQLIGGKHTEKGITGNERFYGFQLPKNYIGNDAFLPVTPPVGSPQVSEKNKRSSGQSTPQGTPSLAPQQQNNIRSPSPADRKHKERSRAPSAQSQQVATPQNSSSPQLNPQNFALQTQTPPVLSAGMGSVNDPSYAQQYPKSPSPQLNQQYPGQMQPQPQQYQMNQPYIGAGAGQAQQYPANPQIYNQAPQYQNPHYPGQVPNMQAYSSPQNQRSSTPPQKVEQPLPPGWESAVDSRGVVYYINHNTKTTSWVRPVAKSGEMNPMGNSNNMPQPEQPLPAGWESAVDPRGIVYYINHSTKTTSWERPVSQNSSASNSPQLQQPLPPGWESAVDPKGVVYYINHSTKTTSWVRPVAQNGDFSPSVNGNYAPQAQKSSHPQVSDVKQKGSAPNLHHGVGKEVGNVERASTGQIKRKKKM